MNDFKSSVKKVMMVFLFCFIGLISYIAYFQAFKAHDIAMDSGNKRLWAIRNEVLRGTIYDRSRTPLTKSEKTGDLTQSREYLYGDLYVHPLGYVSQKYSLTGLEQAYDEELTTYSNMGTNIKNAIKDFSWEGFKEAFKTRDQEEKKVGNGIITTLDTSLQQIADKALGNNRGAIVALDPSTGEVLAMVSKPTYNPNNLDAAMAAANSGKSEETPLINRTINGLYPPGSTFKTITATSALENISGIKNKTFQDNGKLEFNKSQSLSNAGGASYGNIDLKKAFLVSSNVVFGTLAEDLGNSKLKSTAEDFGFNKTIPSTGFTISQSRFPTLESYEVGMIAQSGIGQSSILATPMQMALVASTIANDGIMMQPTLVKEVVDADMKNIKTISPKKYGQVMSADIADTLNDYMTSLVASNSWQAFNGLNAAGKTGTADHNNSDGTAATPHSWFIGFAPANNPKIAVAVIVENGGWGASSAAPVAGAVMSAYINR